ncbi:hypothetical protein J5837_12480 [Pseudoxanthomonas helianthi]|uniref:Uncharacterized protein n=1 Tax=Pseudoxanthomonas helianthi TaxID=1453541 RepID=A0A940X3H0_9GAMM|nr:hypothetical protein [Pseudoxanthomonas helianthi]MBP3985224.1 hypothetical protein [Pseudoxanthomonas helianthi]
MKASQWLGRSVAVLVLACSAAAHAQSCGLNSHHVPFQVDAGTTPTDVDEETVRAPELKALRLDRGIGGAPGTCDGSGILTLRLDWPRGDYAIDQVGFEFRVVASQSPYAVFPAEPVAVTTGDRRSELLFFWPDDPPGRQQPLRMEVEVRAVTRNNLRGPPARLTIDSLDLD